MTARDADKTADTLLTLYAAIDEFLLAEHEYEADEITVRGRLNRAMQDAKAALAAGVAAPGRQGSESFGLISTATKVCELQAEGARLRAERDEWKQSRDEWWSIGEDHRAERVAAEACLALATEALERIVRMLLVGSNTDLIARDALAQLREAGDD